MTILNFPTVATAHDDCQFGQMSITQVFVSELSGSVQSSELPGARWFVQASWSGLTDADQRAIRTFLIKLRGQAGRFYWGDPAYLAKGPAGTPVGTPAIKGASQTGTTLVTDGWTPGAANVLREGDYFHFINVAGEREMKMMTEDVSADGLGNATLTFQAPIRIAPADNASITVTGATCQMMLTSPRVSWNFEAPDFYDFQIEAVEVYASGVS